MKDPANARPDLGPTTRQCGGCSLCCTVLRVDELRKLGGTPCPKLAARGGCSIHPTRPGVCRAYRCLWLRGAFEDADRPDRLGAVVDFAPEGDHIRLTIEEAEPGTFDRSPRLQEIAALFRDSVPVRIACARDVLDADRPHRLLTPDGRDLRVVGEWIETLRDGDVVGRRRMPWPARALRRWRHRLRGRKLRRYAMPAAPS